MYVNPVIEEISGWVESGGNRAPITNKRSVNSIVSVANGETIVIGGLSRPPDLNNINMKTSWIGLTLCLPFVYYFSRSGSTTASRCFFQGVGREATHASVVLDQLIQQSGGHPWFAAWIIVGGEQMIEVIGLNGGVDLGVDFCSAEVVEGGKGCIPRAEEDLPGPAKIRKFVNLYKVFDADDEELTRTSKLRRAFVENRYKDIVDALYSDTDVVHMDTTITYEDGREQRIKTDLRVQKISG